MRPQSNLNATASGPVTVVQMAQRVGISRRRFYELIDAGKFPPPVYRLDNRKPLYTPELQAQCLRIRNTGEAMDGTLILFNRPRARDVSAKPPRAAREARPAPGAERHGDDGQAELIGNLAEHGVAATPEQVTAAMVAVFPEGTAGVESGRVYREVFRHLRQQHRT